ATTIVPEGGRWQKRRAPDDGQQDSEYSSSSHKSSRAHAIDHETAEALNKQELHQAEEVRLQDAATLEDVQKALHPRGERDATRPSSRQSAANERNRDQRMPPPAIPVKQDVRFGNEPQEQPAAPTDSHKTIQQIVRDQVASEPDSEMTTESLELKVHTGSVRKPQPAPPHTGTRAISEER
ncbi:hypothetical protein JB92DRAFT_3014610, partial [Gautieria morchelliformis]